LLYLGNWQYCANVVAEKEMSKQTLFSGQEPGT
jgi:hypothetical protein